MSPFSQTSSSISKIDGLSLIIFSLLRESIIINIAISDSKNASILEKIGLETTDEQIEKILELLKNSLLVQKLSKYLLTNLKNLFYKIKKNCFCNATKNNNIDELDV